MRTSLLALVFILTSSVSIAQMRTVSLDERIDMSTVIVEAQVLESTPQRDDARARIHTMHRLLVFKVFKAAGTLDELPSELTLLTPGGRIGDEWHLVQPALALSPGDTGLFFLDPARDSDPRALRFSPHASLLSLVTYRDDRVSAFDALSEYPSIPDDLYKRIEARTGLRFIERAPLPAAPSASGPDGPTDAPSITGLSPGTVRAGIQEILTITGTGFGTQTGAATVFFDDADDGPGGSFGSIDPAHVVSWSDTEIRVRVPNRLSGVAAGSGQVIVRDSAGLDAFSPGTITIPYGLNEVLNGDPAELYRVSFENENQRGGYTYKYSTSTANNGVDFTSVPDAVARFEEALDLWVCSPSGPETGWSVDIDGTTDVSTPANDDINIVAFDNDAEPLPSGVLGRATSYFSSCGGDTWHVNGIDIRFKRDGTDGIDWYFGSNAGGIGPFESDFLSVALHELGHNVQHAHVNQTGDLMFWSLTQGTTQRTISPGNSDGADDVITYSAPFASCDKTGMIAADCLGAPLANFEGALLGVCGTSGEIPFTDLSRNLPSAWSWDFGDGASSGTRNPTHLFGARGTYTISLQASNANGSDSEVKSDYVIIAEEPVAASCSPTFNDHNDCCDIGIKNFTLRSIDKTTGTASPPSNEPLEEDFTCSDLTVLEAGQTYDVFVTTGPSNDEDVRVYIDWNNDGVLASGELAFASDNVRTDHAGTISVPTSAVRGTALRARVLSDFAGNNIGSACENIENGQVENYSVIVGGAGLVPADSLVVAKGSTSPELNLSWGSGCAPGSDYSVHEGALESFPAYSHTATLCTTLGATSADAYVPGAGSRYFLIAPVTPTQEGSYGRDSGDAERPVSGSPCVGSQDPGGCP